MKKAAITTIILFTLLSVFVAAEAPTLLNTIDLDETRGVFSRLHHIDDTHLIVFDKAWATSTCRIKIVNPTTGEITDQTSWTCTYPIDVHYKDDTLVACSTYFVPTQGDKHLIYVYKHPDDGFLQLKGTWSTGTWASTFFGGCKVDSSSSTSADIFVQNFDKNSSGAGTDIDGVAKIWFNGSTNTFTLYPIIVPESFNLLEDTINEVFGVGASFYDNTDPYNHTGALLSTLTNGDSLRAWNYDSNNPEWVAANGYIALIDSYSSPVESSGQVTMDDVMAYGGRDEILGLIDGWWYNGDFTDAGAPILTNTSVSVPNYDPAPPPGGSGTFEFLATPSRIYYLNLTNQILTAWEYELAPTCSYLTGCYMDEPFLYSDSVLNHGWGGWSNSPFNGELNCFLSTQYNTYQFTPITPSTGTFTFEFDAKICGDAASYLNVWLADGSNTAIQLWFQGNDEGGTIQDHNWNTLSTLGDEVPDPGNWTCSGHKRFENNYKIIVHPQNVPKTYDLYINGIIESQNNLWTTAGEQMSQVSYVYFGGGFAFPYCFWYVDNIKISTPPAADIDEETLIRERNTIGGELFSLEEQFHFDRDAHCKPTENTQLCFLRWVFGGLLDWLWRTVINNPLPTLALVFFIVILLVAGYNNGKR